MNTLIELQDVSIVRDKKTILDKINWKVLDNENWAVIGRNGAGKSFLLRLLSANLFQSSGTVKIFDEEFGKVNIWELKKKIGFISDLLQKEYNENTKAINVVYSGFFASNGLYEEVTPKMEKRSDEILDFLEIQDLKNRAYGKLSQGEQRRVLIARAIVFKPKLLIFDEPCTGLDIASREEFLSTVEKLVEKGHNIIFVTHHIEEIIPSINKVLFLKEGKVFECGNKKEMMKENHLNNVLEFKFKINEKNDRFWAEPF
jgi:iron complex transport system ATP-binding protein